MRWKGEKRRNEAVSDGKRKYGIIERKEGASGKECKKRQRHK